MRTQYCREHIDKTAEECGLSDDTVTEVKKAADFCDVHAEFSDFPTASLRPLIREQDENIRDIAISSISKSLESLKHPKSGKFIKKLTEKDVRLIIEQVRSEIKKEAASHTVSVQPEASAAQPPAPIEIVQPDTNTTPRHASEQAPVSEPAKVPQVIKDKRAKTEQLIEEMLSNMSLRFDGIIERFMTDFPQRFPTKESVIAEALDSLAENFKP